MRLELLVMAFYVITSDTFPGGGGRRGRGRGGIGIKGDGSHHTKASSPILITTEPHHHHKHHYHYYFHTNSSEPSRVQAQESPSGGDLRGTFCGACEVNLVTTRGHATGGGGGGGQQGRRRGLERRRGRGRGERNFDIVILPATPYQRISHLGLDASLLHSRKRMNGRRRAGVKWKQKQQQRGGGRAAGLRVVVKGGVEGVSGPLPHFWRSTGLRYVFVALVHLLPITVIFISHEKSTNLFI